MSTLAAPLRVQRRGLLAVLLLSAAVGWALVLWQSAGMDHHPPGAGAGLMHGTDMTGMDMTGMDVGGMDAGGMDMAGGAGSDLTLGMAAPLFLAMWVAMMIAMMFPASAPMIVAYARAQDRRRARGAAAVSTWYFIAPYVAVWTAFGAVGYALAAVTDRLTEGSVWAEANMPRIAGGLLVAAGIYQLTPLKRMCLSRCRTPMSFVLSYWREGRSGAVAMGLRHGLFCVGCCWLLFLLLLPVGVMNIGAMMAVAALVFAEKVLPRAGAVTAAAAVFLIAYGGLAIAMPRLLPTMV